MIEALHNVEERIFGSTQRASAFAVLPPAVDAKFIIPNRKVPEPRESPGLRYLGYGIFDNAQTVGFIDEGAEFELRLSLRRPFAELEPLLVATVWLWTTLGGLGARVRRGFGSLEMRDGDLSVFPEDQRPVLGPRSMQSLIDDSLIRGLDAVVALFAQHLPRLTNHSIYADRAAPHVSLRTIDGIRNIKVMSVDAQRGVEALERAGRIFREYRSTLERRKLGLPPLPDYFSVKQSLERKLPAHDVMRAAFGLPLSFYFRSLGGARTTFTPAVSRSSSARETDPSKEPGRLPSPLHFRVHRVHDGPNPRPVVTLLNLAQGEHTEVLLGCKIMQSQQSRNVEMTPKMEIIDDAIEWMCNRAQSLHGMPSRGRS